MYVFEMVSIDTFLSFTTVGSCQGKRDPRGIFSLTLPCKITSGFVLVLVLVKSHLCPPHFFFLRFQSRNGYNDWGRRW